MFLNFSIFVTQVLIKAHQFKILGDLDGDQSVMCSHRSECGEMENKERDSPQGDPERDFAKTR
jgi:hypothetical protein